MKYLLQNLYYLQCNTKLQSFQMGRHEQLGPNFDNNFWVLKRISYRALHVWSAAATSNEIKMKKS